MGDLNQYDFVCNNKKLVVGNGTILEIGSKNYGNTNDFRPVFNNCDYIGVDCESGSGVEVVLDMTSDISCIREVLGVKKFKAIICLSVLEHCKNPFKLCENISELLEEGGILFLSIPFVWNIHAYPDDYWRFTPSSLKLLFPKLTVLYENSYYSTKTRGERKNFDESLVYNLNLRQPLVKVFNFLQRLKIIRPRYPYVLFPTMVNAVIKKDI